ncbi:hypothetical protein ACFVAM_32480 [Streptomyces californicus]|uniref:hypothetical protein n=2 Tax=Streptomyces californicus TaxID=67351 RepID=UPI003690D2EA
MHVSPDPITTREQAAQERETLLDLIARGLYCTTAGALGTDHTEPSAEALTQARPVTTRHPARSDPLTPGPCRPMDAAIGPARH